MFVQCKQSALFRASTIAALELPRELDLDSRCLRVELLDHLNPDFHLVLEEIGSHFGFEKFFIDRFGFLFGDNRSDVAFAWDKSVVGS